MTGKPPKVKPVPAPIKIPEFSVDGTHRPPPGSSAMPHLSIPHHLETLAVSFGPDSIAVTPAIRVSVNPRSSAIDEFAMRVAEYSLADYWIPAPKIFGEADAQGIRIVKQRQYVAVADDHVVQVVLDAESGLFRATLASELDPSGPLLKPDSEGRFWGPLDSDVTPFTDSISVQTAELFRRMGRSVAQFSAAMVARVLAVSGVNEPVLRDVLMNDRPAPFLLEDTIRRFELDQTIQAQGRGAAPERFRRFKNLEDAFESDCDENTLRMRRVFPHLPKTAAQAIWRNMSAAERLHMHNLPGMPQRVAKEALVALREIRLARAVEGIHLEAVANPDSDRLVLHMLGNLANWPRQTRVEIRQRTMDGHVLSAIGDARSPFRHILIRQDDGYTVASSPPPLPGAHNLYSTVWSLLSPEQRQALGISGNGGRALQKVIRTQPSPSRQVVNEVLHLAPLALTVKATKTQDRQAGLLRGGADVSPESTKSFESRVRDLYPGISDEDVAAFIDKRLQHDPSGVLRRLENEFSTLRHELEVWRVEAPPHPTEGVEWSVEASVEQLQLRQGFSEKLQLAWQQKMLSEEDAANESFSSFIDFNAELPQMSARFEHVTELVLEARNPGVKLGRFLDSFPNLSYLVLEKVRMDGFASGIFQMRDLRHLILKDCSLQLSETEAEGLSRIETLTLLRLDGNPLGVVPHVGFMRHLKELYLGNVGLTSIPSGVERLSRLKILDLCDNNIVDVGDDFFEVPDAQDIYVDLKGNPLSHAAILRISEYLQNASMDSKIVIRVQEQVFDEVYELSEFSDSGVGSDSDGG
ncbi:leucine-rich repeat domain-containing protein [Pseudomonas sp. H3_C08]